MNKCLVELKMKDSSKTGCFASKWLIEIDAKGANQRKKSEFWGKHLNEAKEKSMLFRMIICQLRAPILPVGLLSIESVTEQNMFFEQGNRLVKLYMVMV